MEVLFNFLFALLFIALAALLAAVDSALSAVSHHEVEEAYEDGRRGGKSAHKVLADLPTHINVLTFVRQLCETLAIVFIFLGYDYFLDTSWETVVSTVLTGSIAVFVVAGVSPRTIGRRRSLTVTLALSSLVAGLRTVLGPVARVLVWLGNMLTPDRVYRDGPFVTEEQLRDLVDRASAGNIIEDEERDMIESVFNLGDTRTYKVMVPRTDLVTVGAEETLKSAMSLFLRSGFSRVPVIGEDIDDVRGVLYLKDVTRRLHLNPAEAELEAAEIARRAPFVPDTKPVDDLLRQMQLDATHVAIVVDEYGGTAGIITIEDIVEEIVGEIADEYDRDKADDDIVDLGDGTYRVQTRTHIEDLADYFDVRIDEDEVTTVGGLLTTLIGQVPIAASAAEVAGLKIVAEPGEGRRHRIRSVLVTPIEDRSDDDGVS